MSNLQDVRAENETLIKENERLRREIEDLEYKLSQLPYDFEDGDEEVWEGPFGAADY